MRHGRYINVMIHSINWHASNDLVPRDPGNEVVPQIGHFFSHRKALPLWKRSAAAGKMLPLLFLMLRLYTSPEVSFRKPFALIKNNTYNILILSSKLNSGGSTVVGK